MMKYSLSLFDSINKEEFGLINIDLSEAVILSFAQDEVMFREGDKFEYIMFMLSGRAKVSMTIKSGKRLMFDYYVTDGVIGDLELFMRSNHNCMTLRAVSDVKCMALPIVKYAKSLREDIVFLNWAGCELANKLIKSDKKGAETILHGLEERLCAYILDTEKNGIFRATMTDVSELLGTSYRHLLRTMSGLCQRDILYKQKTGYKIIDRQYLEMKAKELFGN